MRTTLTRFLLLVLAAVATLAGRPGILPAAAAGGPTVAGVGPDTGPLAGGTAVVITGAGLSGATGVSFGSVPAASFSVSSDTQIVATAPPAAGIGSVPVTVTTPGGTSPAVATDQFTYSALDHLFIIVMENEGQANIIGDTADAPYINSLAGTYGQATNYSAVDHPSLPNYLALTSGQTFDTSGSPVGSDCSPSDSGCSFAVANIAVDRLDPAGLTWKAYQETMPSPCSLSDSSTYLVHHNPFVYYDDLNDLNGAYPAAAAECAARDVPYSQLPADLAAAATTPNLVWITPNSCDDMHDNCTNGNGTTDYAAKIHQGDVWLASQVPALLASPAFTQQRSALAIVWDENEDTSGSGANQVAAIVVTSSELTGGQPHPLTSSFAYSHYSLLRTLEDVFGLAGHLRHAADADVQTMTPLFAAPGG